MRTPWRTGGSPTTALSSTPISATAFSFPTAPTTRTCGPSQVLQTRGSTSPGSRCGRKSFNPGSTASYAEEGMKNRIYFVFIISAVLTCIANAQATTDMTDPTKTTYGEKNPTT